jgi:hypothetical protein
MVGFNEEKFILYIYFKHDHQQKNSFELNEKLFHFLILIFAKK